MDKLNAINQVIQHYFLKHTTKFEVPAKDLMPYFIQAGIFTKDEKNGLPIRKVLRDLDKKNLLKLIPFVYADRKAVNTNWYFRKNTGTLPPIPKETIFKTKAAATSKIIPKTRNRDEDYVLNLCDEVLKLSGFRQHKFDFLVGDSGTKLPVDIYYTTLNLVIEYRETQHSNTVAFFDKPNKLTVSGVSRGEQRKIYDQRRRDILPKKGIQLIEINYYDFEYDRKNKIIRNKENDLEVVKKILKNLKIN